jgi:hypothetical protein
MYIAENKYFTIDNTAKHSQNQTNVIRRKDSEKNIRKSPPPPPCIHCDRIHNFRFRNQ